MPGIVEDVAEFVREHLPSHPEDVRDDKIVHDSVWGTVRVRKHEAAILDTPLVQRLRRIHQTSFAYLTYPSAVHTRFEHSLGCLYLVDRFVNSLRDREKQDLISSEVEANIRAAALLHDVGHGPFSHSSEEVYQHFPQMRDLRKNGGEYAGVKPHEVLGCLILKSDPFRNFIRQINTKYGQSLDVDRMATAIAGQAKKESQFEADILNGSFDVDKLDYVVRDGRLIGLPVAVDLHRLFTSMDVSNVDEVTGWRRLTVDLRGEITLEQIIFGKMTLFTCVYQHHKARACDCLLKSIIEYLEFNRDAGITIAGRTLTNVADFLWFTDDILAIEGQRLKKDHPILHELMHGLAYRRLPKRALVISRDLITPGNGEKYKDFLELRHNKKDHCKTMRDLARKIVEEADRCCDPAFVWVDLPKPPSLKEGEETIVRKPHDSYCKLNQLFGVDQWSEHYNQHKWVGHVFCLPEHRKVISAAARAVFEREFEIKFDPISWQLCKLD